MLRPLGIAGGSTFRSMGYSTGAENAGDQRHAANAGHLPGVCERTSRSIGQVNSIAGCAPSTAPTNKIRTSRRNVQPSGSKGQTSVVG